MSTTSAKGTGKASLSSKKKQHQRVNCQACDVHHYAFQTLLPSWGKKSSNGLQNVVNRTQKRVLQPSNASNVLPTLKAIKKAVSIIYNEIDGPFKELFGMSFAKAQTKTSELNLQEKKSQAQLKKERREKLRTEKKQIEEQWSKRDCDTMLGTQQTYSQQQEQRLALFFETQMKQKTELPNGRASKTTASAKKSDTRQSQRTLSLTSRDSYKK